MKLANARDKAAVWIAIAALWIVGPVRNALQAFVLGPIFIGVFDPTGIAGVFVGLIVAGLWTWYLMKSVRVRLRYFSPAQPVQETAVPGD